MNLHFADIEIYDLLSLLNDFISTDEADSLKLIYPMTLDSMPIIVSDISWFKVVLLVAERQGWKVVVDGNVTKLVGV